MLHSSNSNELLTIAQISMESLSSALDAELFGHHSRIVYYFRIQNESLTPVVNTLRMGSYVIGV